MPKITVIAMLVAQQEAVESVRKELLELVEQTRKEQGCLEYRLHQDLERPETFFFYENWESPEALEQHVRSSHFNCYLAATEGLIVEKTVSKSIEINQL